MDEFASLSNVQLYERARISKDKREQQLLGEEHAEHALFARALSNPQTASAQQAWQYVYYLYQRNVQQQVRRHRLFGLHSESAETLADDCLCELWQIFDRNPHKFNPNSFPDFASIYAYLRSTVYWYMMSPPKLRGNDELTDEIQVAASETVESRHAKLDFSKRVWECLQPHLKGELEVIVAFATHVAGLRPRDLAARFPDLFDSAEIHQINATLLRRLRGQKRQKQFRNCMGDQFLD
ncbi:MAG: hypothetical protein ACPG8W_17655 [Candidatus Promineifilaceae bacterium]